MKILIIDNYDSFVYNIAQIIGSIPVETLVYRNNQISVKDVINLDPDAIVISPGPGHPKFKKDFGICGQVIKKIGTHTPILGICLGHQGIVHTFGGKVTKAAEIKHGKTSEIEYYSKSEIYTDVKNPFIATRYHSLIAEKKTLPGCFEITSMSVDDKEIMGIKHKKYSIEGIQFHPESVMTFEGRKILSNFVRSIKK